MTKTKFKEAIKGMFNSAREVDGVNIARVCWRGMPWMIIEHGETFEDASKAGFVPIDHFANSDDLYRAIYKSRFSN